MCKKLSGYIVSLLTLLVVISPKIFSHGTFFDGLTYASISRNLSEGLGTAFKPAYTLSFGNPSYGHLPMGFWIESVFFKVLGDHYYVEKLVSIGVVIVSLVSMFIWIRLLTGKVSWIWVILLIFTNFLWAMPNNLLENFIMLWNALSLLFFTLGFRRWIFSIFAGFFIFCGFMTKGPVGLFPIIYPLIYSLLYREQIRKTASSYLGLFIGFILPFMILWRFNEFQELFKAYINHQIIAGISGKLDKAPTRSYIVIATLEELSSFLIMLLVYSFLRNDISITRASVLYLTLGIFSSFPFVISAKQSRFYIVPSLPFYALFFSEIMGLNYVESMFNRLKCSFKVALIGILMGMTLLLTFLFKGKVFSNNPFYYDFVINPPHMERKHRTVGICPDDLYSQWETVAIAQRYLKWAFVFGWKEYTLVDVKRCEKVHKGCILIHPQNPRRFALYKCSF